MDGQQKIIDKILSDAKHDAGEIRSLEKGRSSRCGKAV